jgi:hypothetical protein
MSEEKGKIKMVVESEQSQDKRASTETLFVRKNKQDTDRSNALDDTWTELTQDWQAQPTPKTDINALVMRTRKRTRQAKFVFALDIFLALAIILFFFYGVYDGQWGEPTNIYAGLGGLAAGIFVYFETKIRLATWSQLCDSPDKAIDNAIAGSESAMKYMLISKISLLPLLPLLNWYVYAMSQTSEKAVWFAYLMANSFMLAIYLVVEFLHRKRKKEYCQLLLMKSL